MVFDFWFYSKINFDRLIVPPAPHDRRLLEFCNKISRINSIAASAFAHEYRSRSAPGPLWILRNGNESSFSFFRDGDDFYLRWQYLHCVNEWDFHIDGAHFHSSSTSSKLVPGEISNFQTINLFVHWKGKYLLLSTRGLGGGPPPILLFPTICLVPTETAFTPPP